MYSGISGCTFSDRLHLTSTASHTDFNLNMQFDVIIKPVHVYTVLMHGMMCIQCMIATFGRYYTEIKSEIPVKTRKIQTRLFRVISSSKSGELFSL